VSGAWFLVTPSLWIPVSSFPAPVRSMEAPAVRRTRKQKPFCIFTSYSTGRHAKRATFSIPPTEVLPGHTTAAYMRLHVRDWAVNGLLDLMKAYASLFGYKRSVDCEAMFFARGAPSRCSLLSANRVRTGDDVWWGQTSSLRGFL